jgi:phosphoribosylglycinamide formyltransferase 1
VADARKRVAVLISGRGSNLGALIDAAAASDYPAEIVLVLSNVSDAAGLSRARQNGIPAVVIDHRRYETKVAFEDAIDASLRQAGIDLICLAGFMRLLSAKFVEAWRDRILNIHPSLLPLFPGLNTHARALAAGATEHGASVHFVRAATDQGPIVAQAKVPVLADDTPEVLAARVLEAEHRLYPHALRLVASGKARVVGDNVLVADDKLGTESAKL